MAAIPESLPKPRVPIVTQAQADAQADKVIQSMAGIGNREATSSPFSGSHGTLADITGNAGIATLQRGFEGAVDSTPFVALRAKNEAARANEFADLAGTPPDITAAEKALDASTGGMRAAAFANKTPVDAQPVLDQINKVLASPEGKRGAVQATLESVRDRLFNANGDLETDPEMLYGVRKHINDLLAPAAQRDKPELQAASRNLIDIKGALDDAIEPGAPGFKNYINAYSQGAGPIEGMRFLQGLNLTDRFGSQTLGRLDQAIKQIDRQRNLPGARPADSISDDQYQRLTALRDDMRMENKTQTAGKTNSGTFQDLATNSKVGAIAGNPLVATALGGVGAYASGSPLGAMAGTGVSMALSAQQSRAQQMVNKALLERLLNVEGKGEAALRAGR